MPDEQPEVMGKIRAKLSLAEKLIEEAREIAYVEDLDVQGDWIHLIWSIVMLGGFEVEQDPSLKRLFNALWKDYMEYLDVPAAAHG